MRQVRIARRRRGDNESADDRREEQRRDYEVARSLRPERASQKFAQ
jgi:hypothetical protein